MLDTNARIGSQSMSVLAQQIEAMWWYKIEVQAIYAEQPDGLYACTSTCAQCGLCPIYDANGKLVECQDYDTYHQVELESGLS